MYDPYKDPSGWGKSTFLFVLKYVHGRFKKVQEEKGISGDQLDPEIPYSQAMLGNHLAQAFDELTMDGNLPIVYLSLGTRQRDHYLSYVAYEHLHLFTKPTEGDVQCAQAQEKEERRNDPSRLGRVKKDTLFRNGFLTMDKQQHSLVHYVLARALLISFVDLKLNYPSKFHFNGELSWNRQGLNSDFKEIIDHACTKVCCIFTVDDNKTIEINLGYFYPKRENLLKNCTIVIKMFSLDQLESILLTGSSMVVANQLASQENSLFRKLLQSTINYHGRSIPKDLIALLKARQENDFDTRRFKDLIEYNWTNTSNLVDDFIVFCMSPANQGDPHCFGGIPMIVSLVYLYGHLTMKALKVICKIREYFNDKRKDYAELKEKKEKGEGNFDEEEAKKDFADLSKALNRCSSAVRAEFDKIIQDSL